MNFNRVKNGVGEIAPKRARDLRTLVLSAIAAATLAACGGGGDVSQKSDEEASRAKAQGANGNEAHGTTHANAFRLLTQATFGPTDADIDSVMSLGVAGWLDKQLAMPPKANYLARWNADDAATNGDASSSTVGSAIYQAAFSNEDQLRQRVAYALSQIFVISTVDIPLGYRRAQTSADYYDMLSKNAFGNFRTLIQDVSLHPAMGVYLSSRSNAKENLALGRIPDQNFAREIMQLFTIGLVQLNIDGTPKLSNGKQIPTYAQEDIDGLSRVFTGWGWYGPDNSKDRWYSDPAVLTPDRLWMPMQAYPDYHSTSEKDFLGVVVPAQQTPDPAASLKVALDTLFKHPNVAPFISKQLIQRLVTSNPSHAYVARVARVFNDDGHGVRGNLKAVVRAIFMDTEARSASIATAPGWGKIKEPVLRFTSVLRAFGAKSDSGLWLINPTDNPATQLGQSPLRSDSVFNFYRPGYMNAGGATASNGLVAPELQITTESSVAGYANFMMNVLQRGVGQKGLDGLASRYDVHVDLSPEVRLAPDSTALVDDVTVRLLGDTVSGELKNQIKTGIDSIVIPEPNKAGTNGAAIERAKTNRAMTAVLLTLASPEFIVQK